jgi:hypothetical protein
MAPLKARLDDAGFRKLETRLKRLCDGPHVRVGVLAIAGGGDDAGDGITVAEIARLMEYGEPSASLPERSFIRKTVAAQEPQIAAMSGQLSGLVVEGKLPANRALDLLGAYVAGEIKRFVASGSVTPETGKAAQVAKNRRAGLPDNAKTATLVDTGQLLNSIAHEVAE